MQSPLFKYTRAGMILWAIVALGSCGPDSSTPSSLPKIIGGRPTTPGEFPAVVSLLRNGNSICTGTVVAPKLVLSAAHCIERVIANPGGLDQLAIFIGNNATDVSRGKKFKISRAAVHPNFWQDHLSAQDFSLLETTETLPVKPTPMLLDRSETDKYFEDNAKVTIVGFGFTTNAVTPRETPANGIKNVAEAWTLKGRGDEIFVGDHRSDTCTGDSGGPALVNVRSGNPYLLAVTARGPSPCAQDHDPGTMTLLRAGICWFDEWATEKNPDWHQSCEREMSGREAQDDMLASPNFDSIEVLDLNSKNIHDLEWIKTAKSLESLNLSWNHIKNISPLLALPALKTLDIRGNELELERDPTQKVIQTLKKRGVKILGERSQSNNLAKTEFMQISALGQSAGIEQRSTIIALREVLTNGTDDRRSHDLSTRIYLGLCNRKVRSLNPLANLESLETLLLCKNPLLGEDLKPLLSLPRLRYLDISGSEIASRPGPHPVLKELTQRGVQVVLH